MVSRRSGGVDFKSYVSGSCVFSGLIAKKLDRFLMISQTVSDDYVCHLFIVLLMQLQLFYV
jgi:hypothetical protein